MTKILPAFFRRFPVQVTLTALFVYTLTLSHGVTLASLPLAAKIAGWDLHPMNGQPLLWLLTLPLRLLPTGWVVPGLNFFSAICGALTLGIMARSLELAAWDRPLTMLKGWQAKLPIVLACVVCGLEFNFWQEATAATGEMLQILLLAATILCLLKFRVAREFHWLQAATFIWGMGMTENWTMFLTLPLFVGALAWLGKMGLFRKDLLLKLALAGLAGFSIFVILPLWNGLAPHSPWSFGEAWLNALKDYKHLLANILGFWRGYRATSLVAIIFFLVPILPAIVRIQDTGTLDKLGIDQFQVWLNRLLRFGVLLACLWLAFDPSLGPRQIVLKQTSLSLPFLSLDYLVGLGVGFLAGNFLLAMFAKPKEIYRRPTFLEIFFDRALVPVFTILLVIVSLGLVARNASAITLANRQPLSQFGDLALRSLPASSGIILSDDPQRLLAFQAAAAARGQSQQWLAISTPLLPTHFYRQQLADKHAGDWLTKIRQDTLNPLGVVQLIHGLVQSNAVYYLHPSFNYLSDVFYPQATGLAFKLDSYADKDINPPALTAKSIAQNEKFWDDLTPQLDAIQKVCSPEKTAFSRVVGEIYERFHFQPVTPTQSRLLGEWYAVALTDWGVQLQRAGKLDAAKKRFEQALALNENNLAAGINLQCNTRLASSDTNVLGGADIVGAKMGTFQSMARFIFANGPLDDPAFCYLLGNACYQVGLPRQSIQQFERAHALAPDIQAPQIALIKLYTSIGMDKQAQEIINHLRSKIPMLAETNTLDVELALLEANTWLAQTNFANAHSILQATLQKHPDDARIADVILHAYVSFGDFTNALQLANQRLATDPDNVSGLFNQASIYMGLGQFSNALPIFDHALTISNLPPIRLARAIARVEASQYDAAETDYLELEKTSTNNLPIYSGLAEIASRRHDTNRAVEYLERCLAELPEGTPQHDLIAARLNTLKTSTVKP